MAINSRFRNYQDDDRDRERIREAEQLDQTIDSLIESRNRISRGDSGGGGSSTGGTSTPSYPDPDRRIRDPIRSELESPVRDPEELQPTDDGGNNNNNGSGQKTIYKEFNFDRDVINVQRTAEEELFYPQKAVAKPFTSEEGYTIDEVPADSEFPNYNSPVYYLNKTNSNTTYMSTMRGVSSSYAESSGSGMTYRYITQLTSKQNPDTYQISDDINSDTSSTDLDVISVAREFYKDGLDTEYFGLAIDVSGTSDETTNYSGSLDNGTDGLVGLYPYKKDFVSNIGTKYYLYRYESGEFYNKGTDTFTMPDKDSLDTDAGALGAVYTDAGMVVLFLDKIESLYANFDRKTNVYDYMATFGGNSEVFLNSNIYYARLENNEFNYSNNRTFYEEDNPNVIKSQFRNNPKTFPTLVGFYNRKDELIAIGKISKPFEKNAQEEALIRAELSF